MNRLTDIDRLLRSWLDEDELTPPDAPVWAALERIETTRQRGAMRVSLEEQLMRLQPMATVAAVAVMAIVGLAIYFSLAGRPTIGDTDGTPSPEPGAASTERFAQRVALTVPEGWALVEERSSMVLSRLEGTVLREQIGVVIRDQAEIWSGLEDGHVPFPDDLESWLDTLPDTTEQVGPGSIDITVTATSSGEVGGSAAEVVDATTRFVAEPDLAATVNLIVAEDQNLGTDVLILDGEGRMRFVIVEDRNLVITYHAVDDTFNETRFQAFLAGLSFVDD